MVIIDEKSMHPPPPYAAPHSPRPPPPPFPIRLARTTISALPPNALLHIVYLTFPQTPGIDQGRLERQRKTLYWLSVSLRLVDRAFYIACMHVLRSTYLPAYDSLIRPPYSSDPFPNLIPSYASSTSPQWATSPIQTIQRETSVLDLFIALKVREDVWMDDSELHLEREESFKDLFDLNQPRSRIEDLVRIYGVKEGVVALNVPSSPTSPGGSRRRNRQAEPLPFSALSVSFSTRRVGLQLASLDQGGSKRKRTIVEVARGREEALEVVTKKLIKELRAWLGTRE